MRCFLDKYDVYRFSESTEVFNTTEPVGSIRDFKKEIKEKESTSKCSGCPTSGNCKLVNIICCCLNHNHYHFIIEQLVNGGISEFMKR